MIRVVIFLPIWGWCDTLSEWVCDGVVMSSKERKPCEFILDLWVCIINSICPSAINTACLTDHPLPRFFHTSISPSLYTPRLTLTHFSTPHITHHPLLLAKSDLIVRVHISIAVPHSSLHGSPHGCHSDRSDPVVCGWPLSKELKASGHSQGMSLIPWLLWPLTLRSISAHLLILTGLSWTPANVWDDHLKIRPDLKE